LTPRSAAASVAGTNMEHFFFYRYPA
jgi:hypothetical protein